MNHYLTSFLIALLTTVLVGCNTSNSSTTDTEPSSTEQEATEKPVDKVDGKSLQNSMFKRDF